MGAGWALPHDLARCRNEIWVGIPRTSFFATFAFFAAKTLESGWERDGPRGTRVLRGILTGQGAERDVARASPPLLQGRGGLATSSAANPPRRV